MVRFKVVTTSYNCADYIGRCLQSLEDQTYKNYTACVIDDASTDPRQRPIIERYCERNGWRAIFNPVNRQGMATMIQAIEALECEDEDVVVILDGDDWLYNERVLEHVKRVYIEQDVLLTWGELIRASNGTLGVPIPIPRRWVRKGLYRQQPYWLLSHLRTFKYLLWRHIRDEDLRDASGHYLNRASDLATMYPMAEMAGDRVAHIEEVLYVYNDLNPLNDFKLGRPLQEDQGAYIRSLPRYKRLKRL
ncbi:MAG: glycosyltransferase family 2 protein [Parachlamydiales bacterium]